MDAVILAGGFGTRLRPLTYTHPKPLLPIAGRPMVEWVLDRLPPEVDRVIVAVNWQAEKLEAHFARSKRDLEFIVVRETEPLGTAGAVKNCEEHLRSDQLFVLNADIVSDMDMEAMVKQHGATNAVATISLKEVAKQDVVNYGVVAQDSDDARRIRGFVEKPATPDDAPSRLINAGAYLLERSVIDMIPAGKMVSMEKEIFPQLLEQGFYGCPFEGAWIDVGDPVRLLDAAQSFDPETWNSGGAKLAKGAAVARSTAGANLTVGEGATVVECVLGDNVTVSPRAVLTNCVVGDNETVTGTHLGTRIWTQGVPAGYPDKQVGNALTS